MSSVLYDVPGPRARRRYLIGTVLATVVVLAVLAVVVFRLAERGQFDADKWSAILNPADDDFLDLWTLLLGTGLANTLSAAALAMVFSLVVGTLLAVVRLTSEPWYRWAVVGLVELLRGLPVVILIYATSRLLPAFGIDLPILWYLVIGLTLYNSVIIAEIIRAGVNSLPSGQREAAMAVGMSRGQSLRLILLPQAFRVMLPALISQLVVILKDTALGFIISYQELLQTARIAALNLDNIIPMFVVAAVIFIAINYALSRLAVYVEKRLSRSSSTVAAVAPGKALTGAGVGGGD